MLVFRVTFRSEQGFQEKCLVVGEDFHSAMEGLRAKRKGLHITKVNQLNKQGEVAYYILPEKPLIPPPTM